MNGDGYVERLEEYLRKFRNPVYFVNKILKSIPVEVDFIDTGSFEIRFSNVENCVEIDDTQKEAIKDVAREKTEKSVFEKDLRIFFSPVFNSDGEVVEAIRCVVKQEANDSRVRELESVIKTLQREIERYGEKTAGEFEKNIRENFEKRLNEKEREVIYAIARFPEKTEAEISKEIGIKRSTLSSVKARLKNRGLFKIANLPNLNILNIEVMAFFYMEIKKPVSLKELDYELPPEVIFLGQSQNYVYGIFVGGRYGLFEKFVMDFSEAMKNLLKGKINKILFLRDVSEVWIRDFKFLLKKTNSQKGDFLEDKIFKKTGEIPENDRRLFFEFIKHPEASINELSKSVWFSRPTLLSKKKKFLKEGSLVPIFLLNIVKMGFKKMAIINIEGQEESALLKKFAFVFLKKRKSQTYILFARNNSEINSIVSKARERYNIKIEIIDLEGANILKEFDMAPLVEKQLF